MYLLNFPAYRVFRYAGMDVTKALNYARCVIEQRNGERISKSVEALYSLVLLSLLYTVAP
jgi:tetrahydromethanopterin S-methyltransferase subunit G